MSKVTTRRSFLKQGSLVLLGAGATSFGNWEVLADEAGEPEVRFGLVTDLHYADKPTAGTRHYRESLTKLEEAGEQFAKDKTEFVVELGDFIDAADSVTTEQKYLRRVNDAFRELPGDKHSVLGNHCVYTLTKEEFLDGIEQPKSYYSFDVGEHHFVVLDSCFRSDGTAYGRKNFEWTDPNIPEVELEWLKADLEQTTKSTIVFAHQRLDVENHYGVRNSKQVRAMLEACGNVRAVFQGHSHRNDHRLINDIHYCTLVAMVEGSGATNSGYSVVDLIQHDAIRISGYRKQSDYDWSRNM